MVILALLKPRKQATEAQADMVMPELGDRVLTCSDLLGKLSLGMGSRWERTLGGEMSQT